MFGLRKHLAVSLMICVLGVGVVTQTACPGEKLSRNQALSYASEALATTKEIVPVFASAGFVSEHVNKGVQIGESLVSAFRDNRDADALTLTASFIDATDRIVIDVLKIQDQAKRTLALAFTAGVRIALRNISGFLKPAEDSGAMRSARPGAQELAAAKVQAFAKSKSWRCRNAVTGRFEKMEFCRNNPTQSVVETR